MAEICIPYVLTFIITYENTMKKSPSFTSRHFLENEYIPTLHYHWILFNQPNLEKSSEKKYYLFEEY